MRRLLRIIKFHRLLHSSFGSPQDFSVPCLKQLILPVHPDPIPDIRQKFTETYPRAKCFRGASSAWVFLAEQGRLGQLGFFMAHISMVGILIGIVLAARGYEFVREISKGQSLTPLFLIDPKGMVTQLDFGIRCEDFTVARGTESSDLKKMWCLLTVEKNGAAVRRQKIDQNTPLRYGVFDFYQNRAASVRELFHLCITRPDGTPTTLGVRNGDIFLLPGSKHPMQVIALRFDSIRLRVLGSQIAFWVSRTQRNIPIAGQPYAFQLVSIDRAAAASIKIVYDPGKYILWVATGCAIIGFFILFVCPYRRVCLVCACTDTECTVTVSALPPQQRDDLSNVFAFLESKAPQQPLL